MQTILAPYRLSLLLELRSLLTLAGDALPLAVAQRAFDVCGTARHARCCGLGRTRAELSFLRQRRDLDLCREHILEALHNDNFRTLGISMFLSNQPVNL